MPTPRLLPRSPEDFDSDSFDQTAVAVELGSQQNGVEYEPHQHRKGQLILALQGAVTCEVSDSLWLVPPQHAVWIPGEIAHSCRATENAHIFFLFIEPGATVMPEKCCTVAITPVVREMICHVAKQEPTASTDGPTARLIGVLLEQLSQAPVEQLHLPMSDHPKIRRISNTLIANPGDRTTLRQWADLLAMSERSLARLVENTTGLTFGRWRQQLHLMIALSHLAEGQSVQNVAGTLGYDSVNAFITMFKKALGKSPTQYFSSLM